MLDRHAIIKVPNTPQPVIIDDAVALLYSNSARRVGCGVFGDTHSKIRRAFCARERQWSMAPPRRARIEISCDTCGSTFLVTEARLKRPKPPRFCSLACRDNGLINPALRVDVTCAECGIMFTKRSDHLHEKNYCSQSCFAAARRVEGAKWRDPKQIKTYMRSYLEKQRDRHNKRNREWAEVNRDKKLAIQKKYRDSNKHKISQTGRARRVPGDFTAEQWEAIKARYNFTCLSCGRQEPTISLEADHIVPLAKGGPHTASNIQPLCRSCNASKSTKTIDFRAAEDTL